MSHVPFTAVEIAETSQAAAAESRAIRTSGDSKRATPRHIAIAPELPHLEKTPDAARRWISTLSALIEKCCTLSVDVLSVHVSAPEQSEFKRELHRLLAEWLTARAPALKPSGVSFRALGRSENDDRVLLSAIEKFSLSGERVSLRVNLGINYNGRAELAEAARGLANSPRNNESVDVGTEEVLRKHIASAQLPPVDLLIRTGGLSRLSDFLLWQSAYAELLFVDAPWSEFSSEHLSRALADYASRSRTFGGLGVLGR